MLRHSKFQLWNTAMLIKPLFFSLLSLSYFCTEQNTDLRYRHNYACTCQIHAVVSHSYYKHLAVL